jgi:hypothetical protein
MEPLIFKIETQADDSGVRKFDKSVGGLDSSAKKASAALGSFSRDLLNARSGADVAAAGADALSKVLQKSLAGAAVIGGIKIVADQIKQMAEIIRSAGEATGAAVTQLERMGEVKGLEDATRAVGVLEGSLDGVSKQLGSIKDGNWFTKLIDGATGTSKELEQQRATLERLRDGLIALGFASERNNAERMQGLTDEQKQYDAIDQRLNKRLELADKISDESVKAAAKQDATALAEIEKRNLTIKLTEEQGKKEADLATQREKDAAAELVAMEKIREAQQKRFNELYDAEIKAQEATQKRIDANNKAEQDLADKRQSLEQDLKTAKAQMKIQSGGVAQETAANMSGGSASRGAGQRETSFEAGLRRDTARAEQRSRTAAADAQMQRKIDEIKQERAAAGDTRFTGKTDAMNRMADEAKAAAEASGRASMGTDQMAQDVADASKALSDFQQASQSSSATQKSFSSNLSELGTGFDEAMNNANNFSESMTENGGNMVDDFLKAGSQSSDLGNEFDKTAEAANSFGKELQKRQAGEAGTSAGRGKDGQGAGSLSSIEKLLQKNFDELKAYAHAT